jgi:hypothetical protein
MEMQCWEIHGIVPDVTDSTVINSVLTLTATVKVRAALLLVQVQTEDIQHPP